MFNTFLRSISSCSHTWSGAFLQRHTGMSGFEVVGVVLGALPLAIEGAKAYKKLYKIAKDVPRGLRDLIRDLETEKIRLDVTCEHLLDGVAPQHEIRELMKTPFGIAWGPYRELIDIRLWGCLDTVQYRIQEMLKASLDLKEKLSTRRREKSWDAIGDIGSKLKTVFHSQSGNKVGISINPERGMGDQ